MSRIALSLVTVFALAALYIMNRVHLTDSHMDHKIQKYEGQ